MFSATFNPAEAEKLFAGTGHTFAELLALADAQKPLPRFVLKKTPHGIGDDREQQPWNRPISWPGWKAPIPR